MKLNQDEKELLTQLLNEDLIVNEEFYYDNGDEYKEQDNNWTFIKANNLLAKLL
jgi:hypothetical protein